MRSSSWPARRPRLCCQGAGVVGHVVCLDGRHARAQFRVGVGPAPPGRAASPLGEEEHGGHGCGGGEGRGDGVPDCSKGCLRCVFRCPDREPRVECLPRGAGGPEDPIPLVGRAVAGVGGVCKPTQCPAGHLGPAGAAGDRGPRSRPSMQRGQLVRLSPKLTMSLLAVPLVGFDGRAATIRAGVHPVPLGPDRREAGW